MTLEAVFVVKYTIPTLPSSTYHWVALSSYTSLKRAHVHVFCLFLRCFIQLGNRRHHPLRYGDTVDGKKTNLHTVGGMNPAIYQFVFLNPYHFQWFPDL